MAERDRVGGALERETAREEERKGEGGREVGGIIRGYRK